LSAKPINVLGEYRVREFSVGIKSSRNKGFAIFPQS
jgi:hypothetical protein